ncbi:MAG: esterase family protein [Chloroflexi bacterium]|nr:esterase family protein [Chloroflexota bacterium]
MKHPLLERAQREGTPLIDGETATFVWHGEQAPQLLCDLNDWDPARVWALDPVAPGVWTHTLTLPTDAYVEYAYWQGDTRVPDPLNPRTVPNGMGHTNHYFTMPGAAPTPLMRRTRRVPQSRLTRHVIQHDFWLVGGKRTVYLSQPPTADPCPLLVVLDGQDYRQRGRVVQIVDNLMAQGRIRPLALALIHNGGPARGIEYACAESTLGLILDHVLPLAQAHLPLLDVQTHPGAYGVLGASMGGLMALYMGLRAPHVFGYVLSQSGAFTMMGRDLVVYDLVRDGPVRPIRIWMDVGRYEWLLPTNQHMHALLEAKGYDVTYREYNGGHNYSSWRDDVWRGLELLLNPEGAW